MNDFAFETRRETRERQQREAEAFARFRVLWQSYRSALSQPFGKTREEDAQITSRVDAAFQALDQLAKEV